MDNEQRVKIAIVDYGLGNLFSIKRACEYVGMDTVISSDSKEILLSDAVILPGVGAFGDAMGSLRRLDLVSPLKETALSGKYMIGICLGMQLLMSESFEFGRHDGLDLVKGQVVRFNEPADGKRALKVPSVGWRKISITEAGASSGSPLYGIDNGSYMYFVHSFYVKPSDSSIATSISRYGDIEFVSSLREGNITGFQFHPERSANTGIQIYRNLKDIIRKHTKGIKDV
ncbi:MAG: imidazole glycerol phosphate synthase subunit HisH [Candidatus Omnitrophota bacterium]